MHLLNVPYERLRGAISIAYAGDNCIFRYYDQNALVESINDIVNDTYRKIEEYAPLYKDNLKCYEVYDNGSLIGYVVICKEPAMLLSFGVNKHYRSKERLETFFQGIQQQFAAEWTCALWNRNERAINWLKKCGLEVMEETQIITLLKFK